MKHNSRKVLLIMMVFLSLFGMFGCGPKSKVEQAEKKILETLHEKYGKEFELKTIGGGWGTMNNNTLKAVVKPKDDPTIHVAVEITKDMKNVYDNYLNHVVARAAKKPIEEMANRIWGESRVEVYNDTRLTYPEHSDINMTYEQFLDLYPMNIQVVRVFLNGDKFIDDNGDMDQEKEIENYKQLAQMLIDKKYMSSSITFWYLSSDAYYRYDDVINSDRDILKFFEAEEQEYGEIKKITANGIDINGQGQIITKEEEYYEVFNVWKEKRMKRAEIKGDLHE